MQKFFTLIIILFIAGCSPGPFIRTTVQPGAVEEPVLTPSGIATTTLHTGIEQVSPNPEIMLHPAFTITPVSPEPIKGKLAFARNDSQDSNLSGIYIVDLETKAWQMISKVKPVWFQNPTWSPDGKEILYEWLQTGVEGNQISFIDLTEKTDTFLIEGSHPSFSPDGGKMIFTKDLSGNELFIMNLENRKTTRLIEMKPAGYPAWSPDGLKIAFLSNGGSGVGLFITNIATLVTNQVDLKISPGWSRIAWSPNSKQIAYRSSQSCGDICIADVTSGQASCITNSYGGERDPAWSMDGQWIVFAARDSIQYCDQTQGEALAIDWKLYGMKPDGSDKQPISVDVGESDYTATGAVFSPVIPLAAGNMYFISPMGDRLRMRENNSLASKILKQLNMGDRLLFLSGPVDKDHQRWWKVKTDDGMEGWVAEQDGWFQYGMN